MPVFELVVAIQKLEREALKAALQRTAGYIFERNGVLRKIENLGFRELPYYIKANKKKHHSANFFIFMYDIGTHAPKEILEKLRLDADVVRVTNYLCALNPIALHHKPAIPECTLHQDLQPPPMRPNVIKLQEIGQAKKRTSKGANLKNPKLNVL